jgi:hypothetical protein
MSRAAARTVGRTKSAVVPFAGGLHPPYGLLKPQIVRRFVAPLRPDRLLLRPEMA